MTVFLTALAADAWPGSELSFYASTATGWILAELSLVALLLAYSAFRGFRVAASRILIGVIGVGLLCLPFVSLVWPNAVGPNGLYQLPIDIFLTLEGGTIALLAVLELRPAKHHGHQVYAHHLHLVREWLRVHRLTIHRHRRPLPHAH